MTFTVFLAYYYRHTNTCSNVVLSGTEVSNTHNALNIEDIDMETNPVYITNSLPTEPNVAYDTSIAQGVKPHDYDYVVL